MTETNTPCFVMERNERFKIGVSIRPPVGLPLSCLIQCVEK